MAIAVPEYIIPQKQALDFMVKINELDEEEAHKLEVLYRASGIDQRHTVVEDYTKLSDFTFFPNDLTSDFPSTQKRMEFYRKEALKLSSQSIEECLAKTQLSKEDITHLITVTCTGLHAPGLDLDLIDSLDFPSNIERTNINFMGCYAAFNALKVADSICKSTEAKVLIVCTELCTLHFQKGKLEDDLLANALFADGSAAVLVESSTEQENYLTIKEHKCDILTNGKSEMAWGIGAFGFEMKLSSYVPDVIQGGIDKLLRSYTSKHDYYAIHPGGKRILKVIEEALGIPKELNSAAHEVLRKYGNMSSPTVLFVLYQIFSSALKSDHDKQVLALAFGPGITLESMTFTIHQN